LDSAAAAFGVEELRISGAEYDTIRLWALERFGLDLRQGKQSLVVARLGKILRRRGLSSIREYLSVLANERGDMAGTELIDALTTNHTSFFRESDHFSFLTGEVLPKLRAARRPLRIWSAACSSGEEPYSIAFTILDTLGPEGLASADILATDISTKVLERARRGMYREEQVAGIARASLGKYFLRGTGSASGWYKVRPEIAARVRFERLNLMDSWPYMERFPAIFCRNVMIYFNKDTQSKLVERLVGLLEPGGHLLVGHAESLSGIQCGIDYVRPAVYRRPATAFIGKK
jgi:chemotaxis protein methyltransferase CheR